ncbi:MAG: hypothetical protein ACK4RK_01710 [Gemmataceae bacterium]
MNHARIFVLAGLMVLGGRLSVQAQTKPAADKPAPSAPGVRLILGPAEAAAVPTRVGCPGFVHTGGGNIIVSQPAPNVIHVLMTGAALAKGHLYKDTAGSWSIDLAQDFEVVFAPDVKSAKLTLDGRLIGVLRGSRCGKFGSTQAEVSVAHAEIAVGPETIMAISIPPRSVGSGENQEVYARGGPVCVPIVPACFTLRQKFDISASVHKAPFLVNGTAAEFAPEPAYNPALYGIFDPFIGTATRDFGFYLTITATPVDTE